MKTHLLFFVLLAASYCIVVGQTNTELAHSNMEVSYVKLPLQAGTLDEEGNTISHILVMVEKMSEPYEVDTAKLKDEIFEHIKPNISTLKADPVYSTARLNTGDYYRVEAFYEKVPIKAAALDEHGNDISFVFMPADMERNRYEVIISEYKGGLYEILRTNMYVKFRSFRGFRIYSSGNTGILDVDANPRSSRFYVRF